MTKAARRLDSADQLAAAVLEAGSEALTAQSGPVYLGVPTDLLSRPVPSAPVSVTPRQASPDVAPEKLDRAAGVLAEAQRPLIWAGGGAVRSGAGPLVGELALKLTAPVVTTYMGRGLLAPDHPCLVPGPVHARPVGALWDEADAVLGIGTDFDGTMTQNWLMPQPPTLIGINVDAADATKNYECDLVLEDDASAVLAGLLPRIPRRDGLPDLERRLKAVGGEVATAVAEDEPQAAQLLEIVERVLPPEASVVADMCIPGYWLGGYWRPPLPRKLAYPVGWGTLGFGFPASLGAALAGAGPVVCVTGDGGFLFACGELATVVQAGIPVTIVLVDDGGYGMLRFDQEHAGDQPFGVDLVGPDFEALARSFGLPSVTVEGFGPEFERALGGSIADDEPRMIVVRAALKPPPTTSPRWYRRG